MMKLHLSVLYLWFWLVALAHSRDLFVDNLTGDDLFNGHHPRSHQGDGPVRTIGQALRLCQPSDRIVIADTGTAYRESIALVGARHSGFAGGQFTIEGNGATLDGRAEIPLHMWEAFDRELVRCRPLRQGHGILYLSDRPARFQPAGHDTRVPRLAPLEWTLADGYLWFRVEPTKTINEYALSLSAAGVGISLYRVHDAIIANLVVQGFQLDGINLHDGVRDTRLINITSRGNGRSGIAVANASQVLIEGCLLGDNLVAQLWTAGWSHTSLRDTTLMAKVAPEFVRHGGELIVEGRIEPAAR